MARDGYRGLALLRSRLAAGRSAEIYDGRIEGNTISFTVKSPGGDRTITFTGRLNGDEIVFTRDVDVRPGGASGGQAIFGALGARTFIASRIK